MFKSILSVTWKMKEMQLILLARVFFKAHPNKDVLCAMLQMKTGEFLNRYLEYYAKSLCMIFAVQAMHLMACISVRGRSINEMPPWQLFSEWLIGIVQYHFSVFDIRYSKNQRKSFDFRRRNCFLCSLNLLKISRSVIKV